MTVRVTIEGLETVELRRRASQEAIDRALTRTAVEVEDEIEAGAAPHAKSGVLERSIFKARITGGWEIGHDGQVAPHARFVHDGTRPHVIEPNKRQVLRWPTPGGFAFAKRVNHPGYAGDPWILRAAREALPAFERHLAATMQGV